MSLTVPTALPKLITFNTTVSGYDATLRLAVYTLNLVFPNATKTLTAPLADTRYVLRLLGSLSLIAPTIHTRKALIESLRKNPTAIIKLYSMWIYYPTEHLYWLAIHNVIPMSLTKAYKCSQLSCAAWAIYIVADLVDMIRVVVPKWQELTKMERDAIRNKKDDKAIEDMEIMQSKEALKSQVQKKLIEILANAIDLPLAINWSTESMPIPAKAVALLGTLSSFGHFYLKWNQ